MANQGKLSNIPITIPTDAVPPAAIDQLRSIAVACGVSVREDADLVELLKALDGDKPIPVAALAAVGEILAQVSPAPCSTLSTK